MRGNALLEYASSMLFVVFCGIVYWLSVRYLGEFYGRMTTLGILIASGILIHYILRCQERRLKELLEQEASKPE